MWTNRYLVVSSRGRLRITKRRPSLQDDEILMYLELRLPDRLFTKPTISAKLEIPDKDVPAAEISPEILLMAKDVLERTLGMRIELSPVAPEKVSLEELPKEGT